MGILRLLLALSVVALHCGAIAGFSMVGGQIAVQSFYIISGFYMSLILNEKYIGLNNSYKLFITNRFIRLYPIYWTVLACTVLSCVSALLLSKGHNLSKFEYYASVKYNFLSFGYLILTNLILFGQDVLMFLGIDPATGHFFFTSDFHNTHPPLHGFLFVPQSWTLALELTFYLIAPFILKRGFKIVLFLILVSFSIRLFIFNRLGFHNDPWTYRFFPSEIMFFLLGYLSYRLNLKIKKAPVPKGLSLFIVFFMPVLTLAYPLLPPGEINYFPFTLKESFYLLSIALSIPFLFNYLKKSKLDSQIGELSYPIYISHMLIKMVCENLSHYHFKFSSYLDSPLVLTILTIIFAFLLNRLIAYPIENFRQSRLKVAVKREVQLAETEAL